jgi:hypothetical protein
MGWLSGISRHDTFFVTGMVPVTLFAMIITLGLVVDFSSDGHGYKGILVQHRLPSIVCCARFVIYSRCCDLNHGVNKFLTQLVCTSVCTPKVHCQGNPDINAFGLFTSS